MLHIKNDEREFINLRHRVPCEANDEPIENFCQWEKTEAQKETKESSEHCQVLNPGAFQWPLVS